MRQSIRSKGGRNRVVGTVTIEPRILNVVLTLTSGLMLLTFVAYAFFENYAIGRISIGSIGGKLGNYLTFT